MLSCDSQRGGGNEVVRNVFQETWHEVDFIRFVLGISQEDYKAKL